MHVLCVVLCVCAAWCEYLVIVANETPTDIVVASKEVGRETIGRDQHEYGEDGIAPRQQVVANVETERGNSYTGQCRRVVNLGGVSEG